MAGKVKHDWPTDEALLALVEERGQDGTARWLNVTRSAVQHRVRKLKKKGLEPAPRPQVNAPARPAASVNVNGQTVTVTLPTVEQPNLGDYDQMLRERGLDPADWLVVNVQSKEWDGMTSDKATGDNRTVRLRAWTITLKPKLHLLLAMPAVHVPQVKRKRVGPPPSELPETIVVEGDHQIPYHDPDLHEASLYFLEDMERKHRLAEHVLLGDTGDYPTISKHNDHPAAMATPNECIQGSYNVLRQKAEAAPNVRRRKLKGNHDWRIEAEQLARSERMYAIAPAQRWEDPEPECPALHLDRLLHLPQLGIELIEDPRGWEHGEIELVPGEKGLVVRHGWLANANTAKASVEKRGRSIIIGHIHRREHVFVWDPSMGCERQGVVAGTMSLVRDKRFPHFAVLDNWLQGCVVVTRWPDGDFQIEHARWNGETLRWRDKSWRS